MEISQSKLNQSPHNSLISFPILNDYIIFPKSPYHVYSYNALAVSLFILIDIWYGIAINWSLYTSWHFPNKHMQSHNCYILVINIWRTRGKKPMHSTYYHKISIPENFLYLALWFFKQADKYYIFFTLKMVGMAHHGWERSDAG